MKTTISHGNGIETVVALEDGNLHTGTVSHVSHAIADHAKALHNAGYTGSKDLRLAARVDPVMVEAYCNRNGVTFAEFCANKEHMRRFLNDPAIDAFRVWKGAV